MNNLKLLSIILFVISLSGFISSCGGDSASSADSSSPTTGTAGSMARFLVVNDYLYTITTSWRLTLYDISSPSSPTRWKNINMPNGIETLYQYNNFLFIGANNGIRIYENIDPGTPFYIANFSHVQSCDPVVVENGYAYATLRGGTSCRSDTNQLDVIDISDITNPTLVNSIQMSNPKGLGIKGQQLFVCDSNNLISYDATDPVLLKEVDRFALYDCFDVIPTQNTLIVSHSGGISQYDTTNSPITFISDIASLQ